MTLSAHDVRRVSVAAEADPETIRRYLEGRARPLTSLRIERALLALGLAHVIRAPQAPAPATSAPAEV